MERIALNIFNGAEFNFKPEETTEKIYVLLNQGDLYGIYRILDMLNDQKEKKFIIQAFNAKYKFNFLNYI